MKIQCAPACFTCEHLSFDTRCPAPENLTDAFSAGGLHEMFDRIASDQYYQEQYTIEVLSQPKNSSDTSSRTKDQPWVIIVDNFLTDEECHTLIRLGGDVGYNQSLDVGSRNFDGTFTSIQSPGRTSTNAWCQDECFDDPATQRVLAKIENLTGVPDINSEFLQLLKYEETQFYRTYTILFQCFEI
jgi:prolyl 4-hydroxylase